MYAKCVLNCMKVLLVGHDFDFSAGDGISRYSHELYRGLSQYANVDTISTSTLPRPVRALFSINVKNYDIVHLMYPNVARVKKGKAKMVTTWHDLRVFDKYLESGQYRVKPKLIERLNIANSIIKRWTLQNYSDTDAVLLNSSQTRRELHGYLQAHKLYNAKKLYTITSLGVDPDFLKAKVWNGKRSDFAYMGSIHFRHKNLPGLLRIFDKIAGRCDANLHIFTFSPNSGELLKRELAECKNLSYKNVFLHPKAPDKEIARYLPKLSAYLQLSKHEGLGMSVLAALAMGTNVLMLKDSVIPRETTKYSIRLGEAKLVDKAVELAKNPRPAPRNAIEYARSFTWERTAKETLAVYSKILQK